jgi:hypothetical protein
MPDGQLNEFERKLLGAGVMPAHAKRSTLEIREHLEDLHDNAAGQGMNETDAAAFALKQIGDLQLIANDIISRAELKTWTYRYPKAASVVLPVAYLALLPTKPLFAGVANAPVIARWGACLLLGAVITAAMFLGMQLSITLH